MASGSAARRRSTRESVSPVPVEGAQRRAPRRWYGFREDAKAVMYGLSAGNCLTINEVPPAQKLEFHVVQGLRSAGSPQFHRTAEKSVLRAMPCV